MIKLQDDYADTLVQCRKTIREIEQSLNKKENEKAVELSSQLLGLVALLKEQTVLMMRS